MLGFAPRLGPEYARLPSLVVWRWPDSSTGLLNPHGLRVPYRGQGRIVCTQMKPQRPIFGLQSRELARCVANIRRSSLQWDTAGKL